MGQTRGFLDVLDVCCGPKRWHFSPPSRVCRLYLRPGRMLRAKKVTFLGTARSTFVLRQSILSMLGAQLFFEYVADQKGDISRHRARSTFVLR